MLVNSLRLFEVLATLWLPVLISSNELSISSVDAEISWAIAAEFSILLLIVAVSLLILSAAIFNSFILIII